MGSRETYSRFAQYYDLYVGSFDRDLPLYRSLCCSAQNILEIGCGTGRVLPTLLKTGFRVTGIDISDEMLDASRAKLSEYVESGALQLKNHDFREAPLPEKYDRVLVTWYTYLWNNNFNPRGGWTDENDGMGGDVRMLRVSVWLWS
ncbi:class I SAM-dependent methyltransferase [Candidatus Hydrogenedentota bacterium]